MLGYRATIAFKAAQIQDGENAILLLRELREMVFLKKTNIAKWENIIVAAEKVGLNTLEFKSDFEGKAIVLFEEDLKLGREMGVNLFPTLFFVESSGNKEIIYGVKPYDSYEMAILRLYPTIVKSEYRKNWEALFSKYNSLTAKEYSELSEIPKGQSENLLNELSSEGILEKLTIKNGSIWKKALKLSNQC